MVAGLLLCCVGRRGRGYLHGSISQHGGVCAPTTFTDDRRCSGCDTTDKKARGPFKECVAGAADFGGACTNVSLDLRCFALR